MQHALQKGGKEMTKEEFKKQVKRYFDSINPERIKSNGGLTCHGVECDDCMFDSICNCGRCPDDLFEIMEEFEKWAKAHQPITNKDKMEQVFGIKIDPKHACTPGVENCVGLNCEECRKWWSEEYKEPNGEVKK